MTVLQVVLRQPVLEGSAALPARRAEPPPDPALAALALASQAAREEGRREGHEQGLAAGYEEGLRQGRAAARTEAAARMAALEEEATSRRDERQAELGAVVAGLDRAVEEWLAAAEEDMVALCYETIAGVLGSSGVTADGVRSQAAHLLERWRGRGIPVVHLHPAAARALEGLRTDRPFTWIGDPEVSHGGCFVRGEGGGALDARLDRILEGVKDTLLAAHHQRAQPGDTP